MSKSAQTEETMDADAPDVALLFGGEWSSVIPYEVRLFGPGETSTLKGKFVFDEEAARAVMAHFTARGIDRLPIDVAHGMFNKQAPPDAHKSLGWFVPEVRDDVEGGGGLALFASDIEWTDAGVEALKKREFRFFSPAVRFDPETRRVTALLNFALTNLPATDNQRPLVLDAQEATETTHNEESMQVLLDTLGASDEASAVATVKAKQSFETAVLSALDCGAEDAVEKIATLSAEATEAKAEAKALKEAKDAAERTAKLDALVSAGKLPPAQRDFAALLSDEQLDAFAETLTVPAAVSRHIEAPENSGKVETLSAEEKHACKLLDMSEEEMLEAKALRDKEAD